MAREFPFRVVLPENYAARTAKSPVLYLLHGLFGSCDNWLELTGIENYLLKREFVVVLPDWGDNWYTNSATIENNKFESSFINEFIPAIEDGWLIQGNRNARAIAGLSMGGYGAIKFALKYSDLFVFAASMSGAFAAPRLTPDSAEAYQQELLPSLSEVFGKVSDRARSANDLFEIVRRIPTAKIASLPYLYFDCGRNDGFLKANRELAMLLAEKKIAFNFVEIEGAHDWNYWDRQIKVIIESTANIFRRSSKHKTNF